jgi:hypothetical protein
MRKLIQKNNKTTQYSNKTLHEYDLKIPRRKELKTRYANFKQEEIKKETRLWASLNLKHFPENQIRIWGGKIINKPLHKILGMSEEYISLSYPK